MTDLRIDNRVQRHEEGLIVRLGVDVDAEGLAEPLRRLMLAEAAIRGVRAGGREVPFDLADSMSMYIRRLRDSGMEAPFEVLLDDAPGLAELARCAERREPTPDQAASRVRCSAFLEEKLTGRGLKPRFLRDNSGNCSFTASTRPKTGRPISLRTHLDHPRDASKYVESDAIETWGFTLEFSTWRRGAPAYDNVWRHPAGVYVHLACRPTEEHSKARRRRVYTLVVAGLWAGQGPPPLVDDGPDRTDLQDAVMEGTAAWVRFGSTR